MRGWTRVIAFIFILLILGNVEGKSWNPRLFPNPKRDVNLCGRRGKKSAICDPDGVLSYTAANRIEGIIKEINKGDSPYKKKYCEGRGLEGFQVAVALVKKMELDGSIGPQEMARTFAKQLHAQWGVGLADCDNGVLLFLSMKDKQIFISTGKGSEEHLSNESIDVILEWMKPYLRKGDYDEALIRAVSNIGLGLSGWNISSDEPAFNIGMIIFFVFFGLVAFSLVKGFWNSITLRQRTITCSNLLRKIKDEQDKIKSREWSEPQSCPVCLEAFDTKHEDTDPTHAAESASLLEKTKKKSTKDKIVLRCGHAVCESCLAQWMEKSTTCPICRKDVGDPAAEGGAQGSSQPQQQQSSEQQPQSSQQQRIVSDLLLADLLFRLHSLRSRYPEIISEDMLDSWSADASATGNIDITRFSDELMRSQTVAHRQEAIGSLGNTQSFGGGMGHGGGSGSSW